MGTANPPLDENPMVIQARSGDEGLLAVLEQMEPYLFAIARKLVDHHEAEASVNMAKSKAHERFGQFRGTTDAEFRGWLSTIICNECMASVRKAKRQPKTGLSNAPEPAASGETPSKKTREEEERSRLSELLASLLDAEREALLLRYFEGWTIAMIASQMERTDQAVHGLLKRALEKLRQRTTLSDWSILLHLKG